MSRLRHILQENSASGRKSLGMFVTNGYPTRRDTQGLLSALDEGGADFIELGMPFSDPLAEGAPIQRSSERALAGGVSMKDAFDVARAFRKKSTTPLVLMGYTNPVWRFGISNFFESARSSGVDAVILPDLPPEESKPFRQQAQEAGVDLVFLIAPTTPDNRIKEIDKLSGGFVYAVSVTGLTGSRLRETDSISSYLERARCLVTHNPLLVGFGISTHENFFRLSRNTDGCIVGSALVRKIEELWNDERLSASERLDAVRSFVHQLKHG